MATERTAYAKVADAVILKPIEGNPFTLGPVKLGATLSYLYDPHPQPKPKNIDHGDQMIFFEEPQTEAPTEITPFAMSIYLPQDEYSLNGQNYRRTFNLVGSMGETRIQNGHESIVRIKETGLPNAHDAFYLGFSNLVYQRQNDGKPAPSLLAESREDGRIYVLNISSADFYRELIMAVLLADLAKKAGYVPPQKDDGITKVDVTKARRHEKNIYLKTKGKKEVLTASQAYDRAKEALRRAQSQFKFVELQATQPSVS